MVFVQSSIIPRAPDSSSKKTVFCPQKIPIKIDTIDYQNNANKAPNAYAYELSSPQSIQVISTDDVNFKTKIKRVHGVDTKFPDTEIYNADHVFEAQIITQFFEEFLKIPDPNNDAKKICAKINGNDILIKDLQYIMNNI